MFAAIILPVKSRAILANNRPQRLAQTIDREECQWHDTGQTITCRLAAS
jgi:hypothetical protein